MSDLVDYLRDKLEHADDPVCLCPTRSCDLRGPERRHVFNWPDPICRVHGRGLLPTNIKCACGLGEWSGE